MWRDLGVPAGGFAVLRPLPHSPNEGSELALLLNQFCDQRGPAALMQRAERAAGVAVEIFVKEITRTGVSPDPLH